MKTKVSKNENINSESAKDFKTLLEDYITEQIAQTRALRKIAEKLNVDSQHILKKNNYICNVKNKIELQQTTEEVRMDYNQLQSITINYNLITI